MLRKSDYDITKLLLAQEDPTPQNCPPINVLEFQLRRAVTSFLIRIANVKEEWMSWESFPRRKADEKSKQIERHRSIKLLAKDKKFTAALKKPELDFQLGYDELLKEAGFG